MWVWVAANYAESKTEDAKKKKMSVCKSKAQTNGSQVFLFLFCSRLCSWYVPFQLCAQGSTNQ